MLHIVTFAECSHINSPPTSALFPHKLDLYTHSHSDNLKAKCHVAATYEDENMLKTIVYSHVPLTRVEFERLNVSSSTHTNASTDTIIDPASVFPVFTWRNLFDHVSPFSTPFPDPEFQYSANSSAYQSTPHVSAQRKQTIRSFFYLLWLKVCWCFRALAGNLDRGDLSVAPLIFIRMFTSVFAFEVKSAFIHRTDFMH